MLTVALAAAGAQWVRLATAARTSRGNLMKIRSVLTTLVATSAAVLASSVPASSADTDVLLIPDDVVASDTRSGGHYEVEDDGGLHIWTDGATSNDKVALYFDGGELALGSVGEPSLAVTTISGTIPPGFQLGVDFDGVDGDANGGVDGILVGEPTYYGTTWWLSNGSEQFVKDGAPSTGGGYGSPWFGTLAEWSGAFPAATVTTFGFSLGSGVLGDHVIDSMSYAGTTYTFGEAVRLGSKEECKNGGWATSTDPVFENQGECVSSFVRQDG